MAELRLAIQTACLNLPWRQTLPLVATWGVRAIEADARTELVVRDLAETGLRQIRKHLDDHQLRLSSLRFRTTHGYDEPTGLERRVDATRHAMRVAAALRAPFVVIRPGGSVQGAATQETPGPDYLQLLAVLTDLGRLGQHLGVLLLAETGLEAPEDLARLLKDLPEASLGVAFNPAELLHINASPTAALELLRRDVFLVYVNDAARDLARRQVLTSELGRGAVDWPGLLGLLEEADYRGPFVLSCQSLADRQQEVTQALAYLRALGD